MFRFLRVFAPLMFVALVTASTVDINNVTKYKWSAKIDGVQTYGISQKVDYTVTFSDSTIRADNRSFILVSRTYGEYTDEELELQETSVDTQQILEDANEFSGKE